MYLKRIDIDGFRNLTNFTLRLQSGLNVIVGENNTGKTNLLDAIRLVLSSGPGPRDIWAKPTDLHHDDASEELYAYFEVHFTFVDLTEDEATWLGGCLSPQEGSDAASLHFRYEIQNDSKNRERRKVSIWGGETKGGTIDPDVLESLRATFLPALRNAEADLRPGRGTRISRLLRELSQGNVELQTQLTKEIASANKRIREGSALIEDAVKSINTSLEGITGTQMAQRADIALSDPEFQKITDSMRALIGSSKPREMSENGLGYNNLLYVAATLSELKRAYEPEFRLLLIEEPEAHLHPQLQTLLLDYFLRESKYQKKEASMREPSHVQLILTTHSPTLASRLPVDNLIVLHKAKKTGQHILSSRVEDCKLDPQERLDLSRFLDITKSTLFFSRGVILVEGIAEALLIPVLAKQLRRTKKRSRMTVRLEEYGVSIVNTSGLAFVPFAKLFQEGGINVPCAILSDSDPHLSEAYKNCDKSTDGESLDILYPSEEGHSNLSPTALKIRELKSGGVDSFLSAKTLEYDLALAGNAKIMAEVYTEIRSGKRAQLQGILGIVGLDRTKKREAARIFIESLDKRDKGRFAQRLASRLDTAAKIKFAVPPYIRAAIEHVIGCKCDDCL